MTILMLCGCPLDCCLDPFHILLYSLDLAEDLADMTVEDRRRVPGLPVSKAEHIVHGLCILSAVLLEAGAEKAEISAKTNLDGWMRRLYANMRNGTRKGGSRV